ncbi:2'-5' RNA ligase [Jeotgalibacillus malaysiensis]|uniref:2'-5' RNA ligase n=1 Tax=Jeotgalibacillus malaysiensis TaxID=1508404 RepID=A0A0B5AQ89_9BACL|nr:2'-5' RNA ligase family protein [Jeotgalibacillus malaysiensis]AJD90249.1 2'-5' RNA ligase [Jeotgalibacillus malaysiensis]
MKVEYLIGIVPPVDYLKRIKHFQNKWARQSSIEPHITVKAQGGLTPDLQWLEQVKQVCKEAKPFQVDLGKPDEFGDHSLHLSVNSDGLVQLHQRLVHEISPSDDLIKQYFELDAFVPHLTLGKMQNCVELLNGQNEQKLQQLKKIADEELTPYPVFNVNFIRIYELNFETYRCEKFEDISLGQ